MTSTGIAPAEVIVIDAAVGDWKTLTAGLSPDIPVILLAAGGDGVAALAQALAGYQNLGTVHLVSHGGAGYVQLGDTRLSAATLDSHAGDLADIASHLAAGADLLLYGCSVAGGDTGASFVTDLAAALGNVDIAASIDRTGPLSLGGDWDLEFAAGQIESVLPFTVQGMEGIDECLGCSNPAFSNQSSCTYAGGTWTEPSGDNTPPSVSAISRTGSATTNASSVTYTVTFSENVTGVDASDFALTVTGTASGTVASVTGSGTSYTVTVNSLAGDGTMRLDLKSSGTGITDASANHNAISSGYTSGQTYTLDHTAPQVASVGVPANSTYSAGQNLDFTVNFGQAVTINTGGGTPRIALTLDTGGTVYADYVSGSGTTALTFRYTVASGNLDGNGITVGALSANGGTLKDAAGNDATLTLNSVGSTAGVLVDAVAPTVSSVGVPANSTYSAGQNLDFTVNLSEAITVNTGGGTPRIALTLDTGGTVYANYVSGSGTTALTFRYTIVSGNLDNDGITVGALSANGGTLKDATGNDATLTLNSVGSTASVLVDAVAPAVSSVNRTGTATTNASSVDYTVTFSENVSGVDTSDLALTATGTAAGTIASVTQVNGSTYTVTVDNLSGDGTLRLDLKNSGTGIADTPGNAIASGYTSGQTYTLDHTAPQVASVGVPANSTYSAGQNLDFTVNFGQAVTVNTGGGTPRIALTLDTGGTVYADYVSGSGTTALTFRYTVATGNLDSNGITVGALSANGGTLKDAAGNDATLTLNSVGSTAGVLIEAVAPTATIVVSDSAFKTGETAPVTITFSEAVTGFTNADLQIPNGALSAVSSSDGGVTWTATFTPNANTQVSGNVITLNNTGVADLAGNAGSGTTNSNSYAVDTLAPTVSSIVVADTALKAGETSAVTITFSEAVTGFANDDLSIANGTLSAVSTSNGGLTWTATLTPTADISDSTNVITLNNAGVTDLAGNAGSGTTDSNNYAVDTSRPTATIAVSDTALKIGETSALTITFSEAVTGFANDDLSIANGTLSAVSTSNGGLTWTATLTPTADISDSTNVITLNNAGVTGISSGNAGSGTTDSNNYALDTLRPTATIAVAKTTLQGGETASVTISFSEAVSGFSNADLSVANGTLSAVSSNNGGITWTATLTAAGGITDTTNVITLDNTGVTDAAGNAGTGSTDSSNYALVVVEDPAPTPAPAPSPTPASTTVDGVNVKTTTATNADGSTTQTIVIPVVTNARQDQVGDAAFADIPLASNAAGTSLLSAQIPTGLGLQVSGPGATGAAGNSLTDLVREIQAHTTAGSTAQTQLVGGGSGFLSNLPASTPLLVQTIVPIAAPNASASSQPLVINGTLTSADTPMTALVIDTRGLPSGSEIQLQNVEFAAVIGAVRVTGGAGSQTVWGDSESQYIVLGADDDILHGGAGNDTVGSKGGNDQIFGDEGDDLVFGGEGQDTIDGGTGHDTLLLVGNRRSDYSMRVVDGKVVFTHLNGGIDSVDTVSNVETIRFTGVASDTGATATLDRLYDALFDRAPDSAGMAGWVGALANGMSMHDVAAGFLASQEMQLHHGTLGNNDYVDMLYQTVLGREADAAGRASWTAKLENRILDKAEVLLAFVNSPEKLASLPTTSVELDFNHSDAATLVRLYDTMLGRKPDESGINQWLQRKESGISISDIADAFVNSAEAQLRFGTMSNTRYVETLYAECLHRGATADEIAYWTGRLDRGMVDRGDVLLGFAESVEKIGLVGTINTSIETI